jgi:glycosyltransferase involved in cell wall biosynthesis
MNTHRPTLAELPAAPAGCSGWPWMEAPPPGHDAVPEESLWPRVSIITPSYNQAQFIEETIRSVLLQNYSSLEYIVVDGGSTDGTVEILHRYGRRIRWVSERDRGQTDAINKGLRMATGDVLAYLNSDDIYLPGGVLAIAEYLRQHPTTGLIYGDCKVVDESGGELGFLPRHPFSLRRTIERGEFLPQQAVFWRREVMDKVGFLDDSLHYAMDYEYFIRIARSFPVAYVPFPAAAFRMQSSSKTVLQSEKHWREALAVSSRYGLNPWKPWYWIRRLRHWGLHALPPSIQRKIRRKMGRAQDPQLYLRKN